MGGFSVLSSAGAVKVAGIVGPAGANGSGGGGSGFPPGFSLDTEDILEPLTITPKISNVGDGSVFTFTTTGNIDNLDFAHARYIRANNATVSTIRGLVAGYYDGQVVTIISIGAGEVDLALYAVTNHHQVFQLAGVLVQRHLHAEGAALGHIHLLCLIPYKGDDQFVV